MTEQKTHPGGKREKFYTVSARLVFSGTIVMLILALILGASVVINKGPITPILGIISVAGAAPTTTTSTVSHNTLPVLPPPIIISVICNPNAPVFGCINPVFNNATGILTVAIKQTSGYNWTSVTVQFIKPGTTYAQGPPSIPEVSWSPPSAVNVTGGLLNNMTRYVNIPIASGPVGVGTNITGTIWAKYQLGAGKAQFYANMSSAVIVIKQAS